MSAASRVGRADAAAVPVLPELVLPWRATMSSNGSFGSKRRLSTISGDLPFRLCFAEYVNQIPRRW